MSVDVGVGALVASHRAHRDSAAKLAAGPSAALLLFYAAECGLKAAYMKRKSLKSTALLDQRLRTHNLRNFAKELRLDRATAIQLQYHCRANHDHSVRMAVSDWHEAWRYGRTIESSDESTALACLEALVKWCQKEIGS